MNLAFTASEVGFGKKDFENLLSFEKDLFEEIVRSLERAESNLNSDMSGAQKDEKKHKLVRFLEDIPEFLDFDGNEIGPFDKGELANLEGEIVEIFQKDKRVEVLEED